MKKILIGLILCLAAQAFGDSSQNIDFPNISQEVVACNSVHTHEFIIECIERNSNIPLTYQVKNGYGTPKKNTELIIVREMIKQGFKLSSGSSDYFLWFTRN
mgnify:CR=1 FL=1